MFQLPVQPPVAYFVQHFLYRGENQGEWGAQLMGNVDEETQFHFAHFFLSLFVHAFHLQFRFHAFAQPEITEYKNGDGDKSDDEQQDSPPRFVPDRKHHDFQFCGRFIPFPVAVGGFYKEMIGARRQVGVGHCAQAVGVVPFFVEALQHIGECVVIA